MTWVQWPWTVASLGLGLLLVLASAKRLVKGTIGTAKSFGVPSFVISVIFIGVDPENLAVGAVGGAEGMSGIALGSIGGAAMVAIGLAFGVTAILCPMRFAATPPQTLVTTSAATCVPASVTRYARSAPTRRTAIPVSACVGDCDGNGVVAINELMLGVNIALGEEPIGTCPAFRTPTGWWTSRSS